jgi:hypothetical protein
MTVLKITNDGGENGIISIIVIIITTTAVIDVIVSVLIVGFIVAIKAKFSLCLTN